MPRGIPVRENTVVEPLADGTYRMSLPWSSFVATVDTADDVGHDEFQTLYLEHVRGNQSELDALSAFIAEHGVEKPDD